MEIQVIFSKKKNVKAFDVDENARYEAFSFCFNTLA